MEIKEEMLDDMIKAAEQFHATVFSAQIGEYKGWNVRVNIEKTKEAES